MTSMAASTVPKFYKSVIDDVVNNIREIFLDDGVDEQVIQELRLTWERKIAESRAIDHVTEAASTGSSTNTGSNSKNKSNSQSNKDSKSQKASAQKEAAAAVAAAAKAAALAAASGPGGQTSVITSNPNHVKNGSSTTNSPNSTPTTTNNANNNKNNKNNNNNNATATNNNNNATNKVIVKPEPSDDDNQPKPIRSAPLAAATSVSSSSLVSSGAGTNTTVLAPTTIVAATPAPTSNQILRASAIVTNSVHPSLPAGLTTTTQPHLIQDIKFNPNMVGPGGHKVVLVPNNAGQYVMAGTNSFVINPEFLNQFNLQGGGSIITTGPNGQQILHPAGALSQGAIQYANAIRAAGAPSIQQVRTITSLAPQQSQQATTAAGAAAAAAASGKRVAQLDGLGDSSDDDDDEDEYRDNDDDQDDNDDEINDEENDGGIEDEEPLNSGDDVSDEEPNELFETDNVVVCQYDKITRSRNKWKFHFKDGIMNLQGKDYVFQKAVGDAEW